MLAGTWTIAANAAVLAGVGLDVLGPAALAPVMATIALLALRTRLARPRLAADPVPRPRRVLVPWPFKLAAAAVVTGLYAVGAEWRVFWLAGLVLLALLRWDGSEPAALPAEAPEPTARAGLAVVLALGVAAAALTLAAHRVDVDDAFYLNIAVDAVGDPQRPLLQEDWMHGESGWPLQGNFYRVSSYELGVAMLATWTRLSPAAVYYLLLPAFSALLVVVVHWLALRELGPRAALTGLVLALLALLAWGDTHTSYGNFAFVRLFHGKAVLASAGALSVLMLALRWMRRRDLWSWLLLALAQIAAMGCSSTGLLVAPLVAGCALLGSWRPRRASSAALAVGLLASSYVVAAGLLVAMGSEHAAPDAGWPTRRALAYVVGDGFRGSIALFALLGLPALPDRRSRALAGYLLVAFVLLFNPWAGEWLGRLERGGETAWRMFWAVPLPFLIGALGAALAVRGPAWRGLRLGSLLTVALALAFASAPGTWTLSPANHVEFDWPHYKVPPAYETARRAVQLTPSGGLVVAPFAVAFWLPTVPGDVRAVAVRPGRILRIVERARGPGEAEIRFAMQDYLDGERPLPRRPYPRREDGMELTLREIERRRVNTVVVPPYLPSAAEFERSLAGLGFARHELPDGHRVWTRR